MGATVLAGRDGTRVRIVAARTGRFDGIAMRAGDSTRSRATASWARRATAARVTVDSAGNIIVADG
jgi:hypothetical protein